MKMIDQEKIITALEQAKDEINPVSGSRKARLRDAVDEAIALLKEQDAEWIYGEDETGVDGWHCSECNFFEPWFYEYTDDIDFIRFYGYCPKCGRRLTSYTGKPTQERR